MHLPSRLLVVSLLLGAPGCGLALDYDPPRDGGMDGPSTDAALDATALDAPPPDCRTDLDCANGNACDGDERCVDRLCIPGTPMACADDDDVCDGTSSCNPATGLCVLTPALECGDDGDPCNGIERCDPALGCVAGPPPDCEDGIACTSDTCVTRVGCEHTRRDALCDAAPDGVCTTLGCRYPTCEVGVTCVSDDPCFVAHCEDGCTLTPVPCEVGTECCNGACVNPGCDDANACTDDHCGRLSGCVNTPHVGACDDGNPCTLSDACAAGACAAGRRRSCISGGGMCVGGACDDATGECISVPLNGAACVDANACTTGDVCVSGVCTSGSAVDCDDGESCTADMCDTTAGCVYLPVPDGVACPGIIASVCVGGRCFSDMGCHGGRMDCDDDGFCECDGTCSGRRCTTVVADCTTADICARDQTCCAIPSSPAYGTCVAAACLGCCM